MPPPPRQPGGAGPISSGKLHKKERILQAINRMNDRDTQKAAADDLLNIVKHMDTEGLPITISCLCSTGPEYKVYARKECARALGVIASPLCPLRDTALQQPHLGKVLGQLRKCLQDADSSVRESSTEALTLVAQGLMQLQAVMPPQPPPPAAAGAAGPAAAAANPVLRLLFECLTEQRKELNAAACATLGVAAPYLGTLEPPLARELLRKLNSPAFLAAPALLAALARTDPVSGEPTGLIKSGPGAFVPIISALVGQLPQPGGGTPGGSGAAAGTSGSGVVGCLHRQADWQTRQAAADMLRATALLLGPLMEVEGVWAPGDLRGVTTRAVRGLESCKFDKVREVRDVARAALAVLEDLQAYGSAGGSAAGWPPHIADKLRARGAPVPSVPAAEPDPVAAAPPPPPPVPGRKSPLRRSSPSPGRRRPVSANVRASPPRLSPERRSSPVFARAGSLSERFQAAHQDGDLVRDPLRREYSDGWEAAEAAAAAAGGGAGGAEGGAAAAGSRALSRQGSKAGSTSSRAPGPVEPQVSIRSRDGGRPEDPNATMRGLAGLGLGGDGGQQQHPDPGQQEEEDVLLASGGPPTFARQLSGNSSRAPLPPRRGHDGGQPPLPAWVTAADTPPQAAQQQAPAYQPSPAVFGGGGGGAGAGAGAAGGGEYVDPVAAMPPPLIPGAVPSAATPPSPVPGWPPHLPPPGALLPAPANLFPGATAPGSPLPPPSALGPTVTVSSEEWLGQQARLRELEGQTRALLGAFNAMSEQSGRAITGLQARVRILEAALEAAQSQLTGGAPASGSYALPPPMALPPPPPSPPPHLPHPLAGGASAASLGGLPPLPPLLTVQDSDVWLGTGPGGAAAGRGGGGGVLRSSSPMHASSGVGGGSVAAGRLAAYAYENGGVVSPRVSLQLPASVQASQDLALGSLAGAGSGPGSGLATPTAGGAGAGAGVDLRSAYREVLAGGRPGDMPLMRLMQRSGPVWNELGHELGCQLLVSFISSLQATRPDGPMLSRILPWLWRLADDDNTRFEAPLPLRAQLLAALRAAHGAASDPALYEKMALLLSTLQTHWSQPDSPTAASRAAAAAAAQAAPEGYAAAYAAAAAAAGSAAGSGGGGGGGLDDGGHSTMSITPALDVQASPPRPYLQAEPSTARSVAGSVAGSVAAAGERPLERAGSAAGSVASAAARQVPPLPTAALQSPPPLGSLPPSARSSVAGSGRASVLGSARGPGDAGTTPPATPPPLPGGSSSPAPGSARASVAGSVRASAAGSGAGGGDYTPGADGGGDGGGAGGPPRPGSRGGLLGAVPSINTLQHDFAALQRDFAAMSPAKSRTPPPPSM